MPSAITTAPSTMEILRSPVFNIPVTLPMKRRCASKFSFRKIGSITVFAVLSIIVSTSRGLSVHRPSRSARAVSPSHARVLLSETTLKATKDEESEVMEDPKMRARHKRWILVVDDEEALRASVGQYLFDSGYQVTACADADALFQVVSEPPKPGSLPDAIVSDVRMPGTNGIQLVARLREDERLKRVPIVLLTAKTLTPDRIEGYRAGADVYLTKPFNPDELLSILDNLIQRRQQMTGGSMADLQTEMANIKEILKQNGSKLVKRTNVYLTPTERQVLELLGQGCTNAEIAETRGSNVKNVIKMIAKMNQATNTRNRTELVRWALETGYIPPRGT